MTPITPAIIDDRAEFVTYLRMFHPRQENQRRLDQLDTLLASTKLTLATITGAMDQCVVYSDRIGAALVPNASHLHSM